MPWICRDAAGAINGVFVAAQDFTTEYFPEDTPEILAYLDKFAKPRVRLPKLTLVDRLQKAGKLDAAIAALGTGATRIRWDASSAVDPNNPEVRMLLTALVGADHVDEFLAPETAEEAAL